jgi:hypothetical protein
MWTPVVSVGTTNIDIRSYSFASGSVTAMTIRNDETCAFDENHFWPLMTQLSPLSSARVRKTFGSAPPCGSVIEKQETISLSSSGFRNRRFCSSVP